MQELTGITKTLSLCHRRLAFPPTLATIALMDNPSATGTFQEVGCRECADGAGLPFDFSFAFQPVVDALEERVWGYEALIRGTRNEPAFTVLSQVEGSSRYRFDQVCRVKIVQLAARLGIDCNLMINFYPNAVYNPQLCIRNTLAIARQTGFPIESMIFEITESEKIEDQEHLQSIFDTYQHLGFRVAIDDFGAGYAGLKLLSQYQPNLIKLDLELIRSVDQHPRRQAIIRGICAICDELQIEVVAEGVETAEEYRVLRDFGIRYFQGYYFARPAFEKLVVPDASLYRAG